MRNLNITLRLMEKYDGIIIKISDNTISPYLKLNLHDLKVDWQRIQRMLSEGIQSTHFTFAIYAIKLQ